jgi:hypothetical protein
MKQPKESSSLHHPKGIWTTAIIFGVLSILLIVVYLLLKKPDAAPPPPPPPPPPLPPPPPPPSSYEHLLAVGEDLTVLCASTTTFIKYYTTTGNSLGMGSVLYTDTALTEPAAALYYKNNGSNTVYQVIGSGSILIIHQCPTLPA